MQWDADVEKLAQAQRHYAAIWQLQLLGMARATITRRLNAERWSLPHPGVVALPGAAKDPLSLHRAALLACSDYDDPAARFANNMAWGMKPVPALAAAATGPWARTCSLSAGWLWGCLDSPHVPHLHVAETLNHPGGPGLTLHFHDLADARVRGRQGLGCTTAEQTIIDLARQWRARDDAPRRLARVIAKADATRVTSPDAVAKLVARAGPFWGRSRLVRALEMIAVELNHSDVEGRGKALLRSVALPLGLKVTSRPYKLRHDGAIVAELDAAVVSLRYGIEVDGAPHSAIRRKVHDDERDHLLRQIDWWIDRFPAQLIDEHPERAQRRMSSSLRHLLERSGRE